MSGSNRFKQSFCAIESLETRRLLAVTYQIVDAGIGDTSTGTAGIGLVRINDNFVLGSRQIALTKGGTPEQIGYYLTAKPKTVNLLPLSGFVSDQMFDMSETGVVVGNSVAADGSEEATKWAGGPPVDLGEGEATAISSDGKFIAGATFIANGQTTTSHAAIYGGKKLVDLGDLGGATHTSRAFGVNTAGVIVGDSGVGTSDDAPFYYDPAKKKMVRIGTAQQFGGALGINDSGIVVGSLNKKPFAFDVNTKKITGFKTLVEPGTFMDSEPFDINNAGDFVGVTQTSKGVFATAWLGGVAYDLNNLIPAGTGFHLTFAKSINDLGQIIVIGTSKTSVAESFVLNPNYGTLSTKGTLTIQGTIAQDFVNVAVKGKKINLTVNGVSQSFVKSHVKRLAVSLLAGNDSLTLGAGLPAAHVSAGAGKDVLFVRDGASDIIDGGAGTDKAQVDAGDTLTLVESVIA